MGKLFLLPARMAHMPKQIPMMYVFAGNNGSGKSTIRNLIVDRLGISVNIDPDALARRIDPLNPEMRKVSAGKEAIKLARECVRNGRDFSIETTLAGGNAIRLIQAAKSNNFEVTMFYVGLGDYQLNIERVANRVRNGGHHIPTEDIIRRHDTSIRNLLNNLSLIDYLMVIDNSSSEGDIVLQTSGSSILHRAEHIPDWTLQIEKRFLK